MTWNYCVHKTGLVWFGYLTGSTLWTSCIICPVGSTLIGTKGRKGRNGRKSRNIYEVCVSVCVYCVYDYIIGSVGRIVLNGRKG